MEKKSQPLLVIWVGVMLLLIIGIGLAGFLLHNEPPNPLRPPTTSNSGSIAPANSLAAAYCTPIAQAQRIPAQQGRAAAAIANANQQITAGTNEITVSIYEQGSGPGQSQFLGSGVIVTDESVLTNAHIVNNRSNLLVHVFAPQVASYPVALFRCDSVNDLAILKVTSNAKFLSAGLIGDPNDLAAGDTVFAMGNAYGSGNQLMDGVIISKKFAITVNDQALLRIRTNITVSTGICGGPLVNAQGEVVGVNNSLGNPQTATSIDKALPLIYGKAQNQDITLAPTQVV